MINDKIRSTIRHIKIQTKRVMQNTLAGDYLSAFKGSGLEFDQLREYQIGDDIRCIDWNSSAKMNRVMIKQFIEERDRTIILAIDISASSNYTSGTAMRRHVEAEIGAALAFIAHNNRDKVGLFLFSDRIEGWIPPQKGNVHIGKIVENLFSTKSYNKKTSIAEALRFLIGLKKRNSVVFMISDWIDDYASYSKLLKIVGIEYDFVAVRLLDRCERAFPDVGLIDIEDPETGEILSLDTGLLQGSDKGALLAARALEQKQLFAKYKIDLLDLPLDTPFFNPLAAFFHQRMRR